MKEYKFTSESVAAGHPDKVADQISDAILDEYIKLDKFSKVACETLVTKDTVILAGEVHSSKSITAESVEEIVKNTIRDIGYDGSWSGFDYRRCKIINLLHEQSQEIRTGVESGGAGDQGIMFGYACKETPELMPLPIMLSHKIMMQHNEMRKSGTIPFIGPDAKAQVTVIYESDRPVAIEKILLSTLHRPAALKNLIEDAIIENVIKPVLPGQFKANNIKYIINPSGSFTEGGPGTDTGLTGRKIIVDTYGGAAPHGGGAFSGKDPTKVDRSAAYMARYIAKNIVAAGMAEMALVQISYAIGKAEPTSLYIKTNGMQPDLNFESLIQDKIDLTPRGIITHLDLLRPIYKETASHGHFGRELEKFYWENTDLL